MSIDRVTDDRLVATADDILRRILVVGLLSLFAEVIGGLLICVATGVFSVSDATSLGLFLIAPLAVLLGIVAGSTLISRR